MTNRTVVNTPFGEMELQPLGNRGLRLEAVWNHDRSITINNIEYNGYAQFQYNDEQELELFYYSYPHMDIHDGVNLSRVDDWNKKATEAALRKLKKVLTPIVNELVLNKGIKKEMLEDEIESQEMDIRQAEQQIKDLQQEITAKKTAIAAYKNKIKQCKSDITSLNWLDD